MTFTTYSAEQYGRVAVMLGGDSAERAVSLNSGNAVLKALLSAGVDAFAFDTAERQLTDLIAEKVDRVLIMLHGRGGEDGSMQGALQQLGIPYTGSGVLGSALSMDKIHTKQIWQCLQLPTAKYEIAVKSRFEAGSCGAIMNKLGGKVMVKPAREGSSIGMAKVTSAKQLETAIQDAFKYDNQVLVEQFIDGREFTVSVVQGKALPSIRMSTPHTFYDYSAKYQDNTTEYFCPSGLSDEQESTLAQLCTDAFDALSATGWGRVDVMQDSQTEQFYLLEANTVPGMTEKSLVPKAAAAAGISFQELVLAVLATSMEPA
ncbi:MAG: D-alanine--D-alanine ligase [Pseudomonadota bacterium]|jgi:D-alanine-D-alanine ligase|uniref:D-alanine--D-alanine ligase n=1 Tax=Marisediminitalea TaxID=2662254 RepID=UPI000C5293A8|nr:D-alanine--D-alanine ligase [Marisediminitalea aggregata]MAP19630.1 D-alanine--D-alanine ligase [Alteromonadaceae bacterium]MCP3864999.1 D-alanine--D-alanine ligase [Aestuariibacter sp.]MEC7823563.1 D-alanine--D-alanine ligase [Pseudomonadota bacterium]HBY37830.1 D-alanine--D-alanine ligase [Alteromonas sp.]MAX41824.1 D-alanine--D-alanine ligase [Alteromonadaceae bacterium]|tara:strand:+ start:1327 stop:2277 length:951 start_codon:yes stop_codon:yes gene_type:complete